MWNAMPMYYYAKRKIFLYLNFLKETLRKFYIASVVSIIWILRNLFFFTNLQNYMLIPQWSFCPVTSGRWVDRIKWYLRYLPSGFIWLFKVDSPLLNWITNPIYSTASMFFVCSGWKIITRKAYLSLLQTVSQETS